MTHLPLELISILNLMRINFFIGQAPVYTYIARYLNLRFSFYIKFKASLVGISLNLFYLFYFLYLFYFYF